MHLNTFFPDGTFNGVEVVWMALVVAGGLFVSYAFRRADWERENEERKQARRDQRAARDREVLFDSNMDAIFGLDAFGIPRRN